MEDLIVVHEVDGTFIAGGRIDETQAETDYSGKEVTNFGQQYLPSDLEYDLGEETWNYTVSGTSFVPVE